MRADLLEEAVKAAEHLERRGAFDQARAVRELVERVEQLQEKGDALAAIVGGYTGENALLLLTRKQMEWLAGILGGYPAGSSPSADIYGELSRASHHPLPEITGLPRPREAVAEWEALAVHQREVEGG